MVAPAFLAALKDVTIRRSRIDVLRKPELCPGLDVRVRRRAIPVVARAEGGKGIEPDRRAEFQSGTHGGPRYEWAAGVIEFGNHRVQSEEDGSTKAEVDADLGAEIAVAKTALQNLVERSAVHEVSGVEVQGEVRRLGVGPGTEIKDPEFTSNRGGGEEQSGQ